MVQKRKVLLVDDDKFLLDMYRKKFQQSGAEVEVALGSQEALDKLRNSPAPDILVLDIIMPDMDGVALLEAIRKEKLAPNTSVIMLTNEDNQEVIKKAETLGIKGYIVKAMSLPTEVVDKVWQVLGIKNN